ncbi:MAG: ferritin [Cenarchaeum sp. SB0661_bin_35]|nr:ferritin [Cenarchaeum sp. SB0666_bin_15]MYB47495.1 ferritin [Cenarchaeum sp. SB0662_bin_33]MYC79060.1 ferritin [Cenarchaeum sp. SB0661_bin_35]MYG32756.1 ferritin [Cenarchaeum sp. SB0677_bin_16]
MKLSEEMTTALNDQIALEMTASQFYLSAAGWCEISGYDGGAAYFYAQADEEREHMLKIIKFMNNIGVRAITPAVSQPNVNPTSLEDVISMSLANEQAVTVAINDILSLAYKLSEYSVIEILEWFVAEQVHEESKFEAILQKFETIGRDGLAVAEIDRILATSPTED